jgi:phosphohistidine swiveling domain-containing protein
VEAIHAWLAAYGYIPVNFCENPWDGDDAKRQLENALQLDCAAELRQLKKSHHDRIEKRDAMLKKIQDPFVTDIAYALAEATTLNEYRKNIFSKVSLEYRGIFEELARRGNSEHWRDCFYLLPQEMDALASGEIVPIESLKKERQVFCFLPDANGRIQIVDSEQTAHLLEWVQTLHGAKSAATLSASGHDNQKELKGFSACSGVYRGTVKVLLSRKDFSKLNNGDVLVTTMTSVDFIPVMKQAGAFVTNEGGITSHAAIVSREMNKPCIIGTKIATQVLKDGDLVEVDANSGVVRIIKK